MARVSGQRDQAAVFDAAGTRARELVRGPGDSFRLTDLRQSRLGDVQNEFFRLFVPVKLAAGRLPTSLPEFAVLRHTATLSDSPVTAAAKLGGNWTDHNLAAITQVGACNLRCSYCYVDFRHLAGRNSFPTTATAVVEAFSRLRRVLADQGRPLSLLRVSGGEPLLVPEFVTQVYEHLEGQGLLDACVLKVESNLSTFAAAFDSLSRAGRDRFRRVAGDLTVHATLHKKPREHGWNHIRAGIALALDLGIDLFPAIGGSGWSDDDMRMLLHDLEASAQGLASRLAVRPFNWSYIEGYRRHRQPPPEGEWPSVTWERILRDATGRDYLDRPRHETRLR